METTNGRNHYFFKGLLFGGALGGIAALLLAPKSGKELRADIQETGKKAVETGKKAVETGKKAFHETEAFFGKARHQVSDARQRARDLWGRIKEKEGNGPSYATESGEDAIIEA